MCVFWRCHRSQAGRTTFIFSNGTFLLLFLREWDGGITEFTSSRPRVRNTSRCAKIWFSSIVRLYQFSFHALLRSINVFPFFFVFTKINGPKRRTIRAYGRYFVSRISARAASVDKWLYLTIVSDARLRLDRANITRFITTTFLNGSNALEVYSETLANYRVLTICFRIRNKRLKSPEERIERRTCK